MADKAKEKETKAVTPWRPFMDLTRWERDMERMLDDFWAEECGPGGPNGGFPWRNGDRRAGGRCFRREGRYRGESRAPRHGQREH